MLRPSAISLSRSKKVARICAQIGTKQDSNEVHQEMLRNSPTTGHQKERDPR